MKLKKLKFAPIGEISPTEARDRESLAVLVRRLKFSVCAPHGWAIEEAALEGGRVTIKIAKATPLVRGVAILTFDEVGEGFVRAGLIRRADDSEILTILRNLHEDDAIAFILDVITKAIPVAMGPSKF